MLMMQFLKPLSDLSFYFAVFGSVIFFAASIQTSLLPLFVLAIAQLGCFLLKDGKRKYLPLALLLLMIPFVRGTADVAIYLLGAYFIVNAARKKLYGISSAAYTSNFQMQIKFFPAVIIFALLFGFGYVIEQYTIPVMIIYFGSSIMMMRLLRADHETLANKSFQAFNIVSLGLVFATSVIISSNWAMSFLGRFIEKIYFEIIVPILTFLMSIVIYIITKFMWLGKFFFTKEVVYRDDGKGDIIAGIEMEYAETVLIDTPMWIKVLFFVLVTILLFYVAYRLLKKFQSSSDDSSNKLIATIIRTDLGRSNGKRKSNKIQQDNNCKVRNNYIEFMKLCIAKGQSIPIWMDSSQVERNYGITTETSDLTTLYQKARYSHHNISKEDVQNSKSLLNKIKSDSK